MARAAKSSAAQRAAKSGNWPDRVDVSEYSTTDDPKATPATAACAAPPAMPWRIVTPGSLATSATAPTASATPASTTPDGRSPCARPHVVGTSAAATVAMGATTAAEKWANPKYSNPSPMTFTAPARPPYTKSWVVNCAETTSARIPAPTTPTACETKITATVDDADAARPPT